jgi:hypothetical protein
MGAAAQTTTAKKSWRDVLPVHPAADLFPMMSHDDLLELGRDIKKHGIRVPLITVSGLTPEGRFVEYLVDGRNRLDAMELVGIPTIYVGGDGRYSLTARCRNKTGLRDGATDKEIYSWVVSTNVRRRHLTADQKRDLIAKLLKAKPEQSNRAIAEQVKVSHHTVAAVRTEQESTGQIAQLDKTTGKDGRARSTKPRARMPDAAAAQRRAEQRREQEWRRYDAAMAEKAAAEPTVEVPTACGQSETMPLSIAEGRAKLADHIERARPDLAAKPTEPTPNPKLVTCRWNRDADPLTIAKAILATLRYEPHDQDIDPLKRVIKRYVSPQEQRALSPTGVADIADRAVARAPTPAPKPPIVDAGPLPDFLNRRAAS